MGGEQAASAFGSDAALTPGDTAAALSAASPEAALTPADTAAALAINFDEVQSEIASATTMDTSLAPIDGMDEEVEVAVEENTQDDVVG
jgi:hypothetical protein